MLISPFTHAPSVRSDVADAAELWARDWGRHARFEWVERLGCFVLHLSRRADDPVMRLVQAGRLSERDATEPVYFHEPFADRPGFFALDPNVLGVEGTLEFLNRRNLWSGRGEHRSLDDAVDAASAANERRLAERMNGERGREVFSLVRRKVLHLPQVPVTRDLDSSKADA